MNNSKFFVLFLLLSGLPLMSALATAPECTAVNGTPTEAKPCCPGGVRNSSDNKCWKDPSIAADLTECTKHSDCQAGRGCFAQTQEDLFNEDNATSKVELEAFQKKQEDIQKQLEGKEPQPVGAWCWGDFQCESYSCSKHVWIFNQCRDKRSCRLAKKDEVAVGAVQCEPYLVKNRFNKCERSIRDQNDLFLGLTGDMKIKDEGQCKYSLDPSEAELAQGALRSIRTMEWFFSSSGLDKGDDCLKLLSTVKVEIGTYFLNERKNIVNRFNLELAQLEKESHLLETAKKEMANLITINDETLPGKVFAERKSSGMDGLMIMKRRNLLFKSLETTMQALVQETATRIQKIGPPMMGWKNDDEEWSLYGNTVKEDWRECRPTLWWDSDEIEDLWLNHYKVYGEDKGNGDISDSRPMIVTYLQMMSGESDADTKNALKKGYGEGPGWFEGLFTGGDTYYLVDPYMPGQSKFDKYGDTSFWSLWSDNRRVLGENSFTTFRKKFRDHMPEYFKQFKPANFSAPEVAGKPYKFVYEPELLSLEARNCIENPSGPKCYQMNNLMDEIGDIGFAYFWSYSVHKRKDYYNYFGRDTTGRHRLMTHLEVSLQNMNNYYTNIIDLRTKQINCVTTVLDGLEKAGISHSGNEGSIGVDGKPTKYHTPESGGADYVGKDKKIDRPKAAQRHSTVIDLRTGKPFQLNAGVHMDGSGAVAAVSGPGVAGAASVGISTNAAAMAKRLAEMKASNAKAKKAGIDVDRLDKEARSALSRAGKSNDTSSGAVPILGSGHGHGSAGSAGGSSTQSALSAEVPGALSDAAAGPDMTAGGVKGGGMKGGRGFKGGSSDSAGDVSQGGIGDKDHTGMSDEEKAAMLANLDRTKGQYNPNDDDGLFNILSKAYVRNLDKVLNKKKQLAE